MKSSTRICACLFVLAAGCGTGRRSEPLIGPLPLKNEAEHNGQRAFMKHCNQCHPGGDAGLGPAINNKPLPEVAIKFQTRNGIGAMPAIKSEYLSDRDLGDIVEFLQAIRKAD